MTKNNKGSLFVFEVGPSVKFVSAIKDAIFNKKNGDVWDMIWHHDLCLRRGLEVLNTYFHRKMCSVKDGFKMMQHIHTSRFRPEKSYVFKTEAKN